MTRVVSNAFIRSAQRGAGNHDHVSFAPLSARLTELSEGVRLSLAPMRALDLMPVWSRERGPSFNNLLFEAGKARNIEHRPLSGGLMRIAARLQLDPIELDDNTIVLSDAQLVRLLAQVEFDRLAIVRIEGPIERSDARFIRRALAMDGSALEAELRATQAVRIERDETLLLDARDIERTHALVAENFRHYVAAALNQPLNQIGSLESWHIERLFAPTGTIIVRPIETDIFSTSVDIGISTDVSGGEHPANRSLIYDRPSASWHEES